jgi:hypothetical protein
VEEEKMSVVSAEGRSEPFTFEPYANFGDRIPVLRSFYLGYDVGDATPSDHEILDLGTLVGGDTHDLSPFVNFPPNNVPDGKLKVELQDSSPSEGFYYRVSHSVLTLPGVHRHEIRQVGNVGEVTTQLPAAIFPNSTPFGSPILALTGFRLFFGLSGDHELDRIGIWFRDDRLHVVLRDQTANPNDDYSFLVDFVVIPPVPGFQVSPGAIEGTAAGGERVSVPTPSHQHLLLTGWSFNFQNGDHRLREIGVDRQGDDFVVVYADKNANDPFDWRVEYAHFGPQVVAPD